MCSRRGNLNNTCLARIFQGGNPPLPPSPSPRCEPGADLTDGSLSSGKKSPRCHGYLFRAKNKRKETDYLHGEYLLKVISRSLLYKVPDTLADNLTFLL